MCANAVTKRRDGLEPPPAPPFSPTGGLYRIQQPLPGSLDDDERASKRCRLTWLQWYREPYVHSYLMQPSLHACVYTSI